MSGIVTKYGVLRGVSSVQLYADGEVKECILNEPNEIITPYGSFVPQYADDGVRRKYTKSLSFYKNGNLKSISLHEKSLIETSVGSFPAELATFHENGNIKRLFPLNGKITGYWTEEDEYSLAQEYEFKFPFGKFTKKVIGILFYPSGQIRSITLWPGEIVAIKFPTGLMDIRIGLTVYPDGALKSCEPARPSPVHTPVGTILAYDVNAIGINGDRNSLCFYKDGRVKSLKTSTDRIVITDKSGNKSMFEPGLRPSLLSDEMMEIVPVDVEFNDNCVRILGEAANEYQVDEYAFEVKNFVKKIVSQCSNCSSCTACG